jgi:hypothetical protein
MSDVKRGSPAAAASGVVTRFTSTLLTLLPVIVALALPSGSQTLSRGLLASARSGGGPVTFRDPIGDAPGSADVTAVSVSSDVRGFVTFKVTYAKTLSSGATTVVYLDSDRNAATGSRARFGADYAVVVWGVSAAGWSFSLRRWNGRRFKELRSKSPDVSLNGQVLTFSFDTSDLGKTRGGRFAVTERWSGRIVDSAPDAGSAPWSFHLVKKELSAGRLVIRPSEPVAGHMIVAELKIKTIPGIDLLARLDVPSCKARVARRPLVPIRSSLLKAKGAAEVRARCVWRIPRRTRGELFTASVDVAYGARPLRRSVSSRIQ